MRSAFFPLSTRHFFIGALVFLTLFVDATLAYFSIQNLARGGREVTRSFETIGELERLETLAQEIENSSRGFLLSGDSRFLAPLETASRDLEISARNLAARFSNPAEREAARALQTAVAQRIALAGRSVEVRRRDGLAGAQRWIQSGNGSAPMREIARATALLIAAERERLEARALESGESAQDATRTFWIATLANLAFLGAILVLLWRAGAQNARLGQAYTELKRAEQLRDNLSAMLVHDLRTPLTSLLGPLQMLESDALGPLDETQHEVLKISRQSGEKLLGMVNQLLDISKMEAGKLEVQRQNFAVRALLERAIESVQGLEMDGAKIEIARVEPENISADPEIIERVLVNLLGNALKFTPHDGQITLEVAATSGGSQWSVTDNGPGIPKEFHERIFDKFGQAESRQNGRKFSTGLGLTFCKLAVEAHGGKIQVESENGNGAKFSFFLPGTPENR